MRRHQPTAIAILGADTVVGRALCALLEGYGYRVTPLDSYPTGVVDELLDGADLLLLVPRLDEGAREAFLGAVGRSALQSGDLPVISLSTTVVNESAPEQRILRVPWPCAIENLVARIEEAVSRRRVVLDKAGYSVVRNA